MVGFAPGKVLCQCTFKPEDHWVSQRQRRKHMKAYPPRIQPSSGPAPYPQNISSAINEPVIEFEDLGGYDIQQMGDEDREESVCDENNAATSDNDDMEHGIHWCTVHLLKNL
jgi:hypothetical protein